MFVSSFPLVPKLRLGTHIIEALLRPVYRKLKLLSNLKMVRSHRSVGRWKRRTNRRAQPMRAKQSFAVVRSQAELGNESET